MFHSFLHLLVQPWWASDSEIVGQKHVFFFKVFVKRKTWFQAHLTPPFSPGVSCHLIIINQIWYQICYHFTKKHFSWTDSGFVVSKHRLWPSWATLRHWPLAKMPWKWKLRMGFLWLGRGQGEVWNFEMILDDYIIASSFYPFKRK